MASDPALARLLALLHPSELALRDWVAPQVEELSAVLADENLLWTQRPVHELLKLTAQAGNRRIWVSLASRCLFGEPAQHTGHGVLLARLGQAIRGDLAADAAELRSLLVPGAER